MAAVLSVNPATGKILARHRAHTKLEIEARLANAHATTTTWRNTPPATRARHLRALAAALHQERAALAALITAEMGKPLV